MKSSQSGNVLFLILIAVALFAALSYAVTRSSDGGGGATTEQRILKYSQIVQYSAALRFSIQRMRARGVSLDDIRFSYDRVKDEAGAADDATAQATWDSLQEAYGTNPEAEVFHPDGGGAVFQYPFSELCSDNMCHFSGGTYGSYFPVDTRSAISVDEIGSSAVDVVLVMGPVLPDVCNGFNDYLDIGSGSFPSDLDYDPVYDFPWTAHWLRQP